MKKLLSLFTIFAVMLLTGCDVGVLPTDPVGLPAAFAHCAESVGYWVWGIIITVLVGVGAWMMKKTYDKSGTFSPLLLFAIIVALLLVWCYRPSELAWNTTVEQAASGIWIGY